SRPRNVSRKNASVRAAMVAGRWHDTHTCRSPARARPASQRCAARPSQKPAREPGVTMPHGTPLITTLVAGFVLAFLLGALASRFRLPPLVGYLLAGIV